MPGPRVAQAVREIARGPRPDELVAKARAAGLLPHYIRGEKRRQEEMALLGELFVEGGQRVSILYLKKYQFMCKHADIRQQLAHTDLHKVLSYARGAFHLCGDSASAVLQTWRKPGGHSLAVPTP